MAESTRRLSELRKIVDEVESFANSNVIEDLVRYEGEIKTHQDLLTDLLNERKDLEQAINKLKEDVASQEIGRRELLDNMTLREIEEMVEALKQKYRKLCEKLQSMNYDEMTKKWEQLENEKQALLRQVSGIFTCDNLLLIYTNVFTNSKFVNCVCF